MVGNYSRQSLILLRQVRWLFMSNIDVQATEISPTIIEE